MNQNLLSAKTIASILSLSKRQVFRLNSSGKIPAPVKVGGAVRWKQSHIELWINLSCPDRKNFEAMLKAEDKNVKAA